jgi:hypothetical protein
MHICRSLKENIDCLKAAYVTVYAILKSMMENASRYIN